MAKDKSGSDMTTIRDTEIETTTQNLDHTLHKGLLRERESIRLPPEEPKDHIDMLLPKGPREEVQVGVQCLVPDHLTLLR
jgi:hypothetical protein